MSLIVRPITYFVPFALPVATEPGSLDCAHPFVRGGCALGRTSGEEWRSRIWPDCEDGAQRHDFKQLLSVRSEAWRKHKRREQLESVKEKVNGRAIHDRKR